MTNPRNGIDTHDVYRFGAFEMSAAHNVLSRDGVQIRIQHLPFQMLLLLIEREGQIVTKDELQARLWGKRTFVEVDQNLYVIAAKLRDLLGDNAVSPRFIRTVSGRGYQFIGTVKRVAESPPTGNSDSGEAGKAQGDDRLSSSGSLPSAAIDSADFSPAYSVPASEALRRPSSSRLRFGSLKAAIPALAAACLLICAALGGIYIYAHRRIYTPQQKILVGSFESETEKSDFDQTLAFLVQLKLQESPYLTLIPDQSVLRLQRESSFTGREGQLGACASLGAQMLLTSRRLPHGNGYRLELAASRCPDGKLLTLQQADADSEASLLTAVDVVTEKMRERLGEPAASLQRFNVPLTQSTTTSLAALKEFTEGEKKLKTGDSLGAISDYKLAIDLDPRFALSYARMGTIYLNAQEPATAAQYIQKAFDLRDRTTDKERLYIAAHYYTDVAGDLERAIETYTLWTTLYPRDLGPLNNLANLYDLIGKPDEGLEFAKMAMRVNPDAKIATATLGQAYLEQGDYSSLNELCHGPSYEINAFVTFHNICLLGAFGQKNDPGVERELTWARGNPQESLLLGSAVSIALYKGRLSEAGRLLSATRQNALENKLPGLAAEVELNHAIAEGEFDAPGEAIQEVKDALSLNPNDNDALTYAAIALALAGSDDVALRNAQTAVRLAPLNEVTNKLGLPTVKAIIELHRHHPSEAIAALEASKPLLFYAPMKFAPAYYRGLAYLEDGQLDSAAESFQQILQNRAVAPDSIYIGLAAVALGRTLRQKGDMRGAAAAYGAAAQIWGTAEVDFPLLKRLRHDQQELSSIR